MILERIMETNHKIFECNQSYNILKDRIDKIYQESNVEISLALKNENSIQLLN